MNKKQDEAPRLLLEPMEATTIGKTNIYSGMAGTIGARLTDLRKKVIRESLSEFEKVDHRLEPVAHIRGIEFINDSKATNVNATWFALASMNRPVIWIAGGQDNGNDYSQLTELIIKKVKAVICLGADNSRIKKAFHGLTEQLCETQEVDMAVQIAYLVGKPGDVVLFSPSCPSFDLFEDYRDRGDQYKKAVMSL